MTGGRVETMPDTRGGALGALPYCCPRCHGSLEAAADDYWCGVCNRTYPTLLGIPDFRVKIDTCADEQRDRELAQALAERFDGTTYRELLEYFWSLHDIPPELLARYLRHGLTGFERGRRSLAVIARELPRVVGPDCRFLEFGCGSGGFLAAAAETFGHVIGIEIGYRWLILAKKRLAEQGREGQLVCCFAEALPFAEGQCDLVVASDVIEHTPTQRDLIEAAHYALCPGGAFYVATPNRYSLAPEPHVRLWGVGFLPRRWMKPYVHWRRGVPYNDVRLLSFFEIKRLVRRTSFVRCSIQSPRFSEAEQEGLSALERRLTRVYHAMKDWPIVRGFLLLFGPAFQMICVRHERVKS